MKTEEKNILDLDSMDAEENARREEYQQKISRMSGRDKEAEIERENTRLKVFDTQRKVVEEQLKGLKQIKSNPTVEPKEFRCEYPGCTSSPFLTQYLLKYLTLLSLT
jgi:hypothetical protein